MQDRRTFLGLAAAASLLPFELDAQAPAARQPAGELARHPLSGPFEGWEAVIVELNISSTGGNSRHHSHPGPVLGYVVEGQMRFAINNEPEKVLPPGATFFEPSGAVHTTSGSARTDGPTRVAVFMLVPKGAPLATPV